MASTPSGFANKIEGIVDEATSRPRLKRVGDAGAKDATGVIRKAIGDTSMSHFTRKKPIDLTVHAYVKSDTEIVFGPVRGAVGASSVLSAGHKPYQAGDRRLTGKVSKKTGKALSRRVKRSTGGSAGKGTAPEGHRLIGERTGKRLHDEYLKVLRSKFRG